MSSEVNKKASDLVLGDRFGVGTFGATYAAKYAGESVSAKILHQALHKKYTGKD